MKIKLTLVQVSTIQNGQKVKQEDEGFIYTCNLIYAASRLTGKTSNRSQFHQENMNARLAAFLLLTLVVAAVHLPQSEAFGMSSAKKRDEIQVLINFIFY